MAGAGSCGRELEADAGGTALRAGNGLAGWWVRILGILGLALVFRCGSGRMVSLLSHVRETPTTP